MKNKLRILIAGILLSTVTLVGFNYDDRYFEIAKNLDVFATMFKELNALYVDEISPTKTIHTGINAMLKELDPYTNFYAEDAIEDYRTTSTGQYNGVGITVNERNGKHIVQMVYESSPADKAGIKIGDVITEINKIPLQGRSDEELARLIKGQKGTEVELGVLSYGSTKPIKLKVTREDVKTSNVPHYGMINDEVGYIQLTEFRASAAADIKNAFVDLKGQGMKKLVLDLRGNPGGLLNMAVEICNFFIPKKELVVETKGKVETWNKRYETTNAPLDLDMPVVVLINSKSASASEIVSGTLQDYDRAVVLGQKSFGKGLVQVTRPLSYNTQMKITTAKYYIPSGRCIQAIDYSHRNPDGSVGKIPESMISEFLTKNGRKVYDGGGVDPDIKVDPKAASELATQLVRDGIIFDFATKYYHEHASDVPSENYEISEAIYNEFSTYVKESGFVFDSKAKKALSELEELSKTDKTYANLDTHLGTLKNWVSSKLDKDLITDKAIIKDELALEILRRYHYDNALKFVSFDKDAEVQSALSLFKDMNKYKSILAGK